MDSLTQAVYGATIQGALLGRQQGRKSLFYGAILGTLPDLDVILRYPDPISTMTYHRGFSHSLLVLTAFSILLAWLLRRWRPNPSYTGARLAFTIWAVLVTHVLLDAMTVYGTQLWWPFMPTPTAWGGLFIIDPVFTLPLLAAVGVCLLHRQPVMPVRWLWLALAFTTAYAALNLLGKAWIEQRVERTLLREGITVTRTHVGPAPLNSVLWRFMVEDDQGRYYEGFASLLDRQAPRFTVFNRGLEHLPAVEEHPQLQRLRWFTDDWLRYDEIQGTLVVTDLRMGVAGRHFFRFVVAERDVDGEWQAVVPRDWPGYRGGLDELQLLGRRLWDEGTDIPLRAWETDMQRRR